jgi:hypothetical protein
MISVLMFAACAIFIIAFVMYVHGIFRDRNFPNLTGWILFSFIALINGLTYNGVTGDWITATVVFTDCFVCTATVLLAIGFKANKIEVDRWDILNFAIGLLAIAAWWHYKAVYGNLIIQVAYTLAFVPSYRNARKGGEPWKPWVLWAAAWMINILVVPMTHAISVMDYVTPVSAFIQHVAIAVIAIRRNSTVTVQL